MQTPEGSANCNCNARKLQHREKSRLECSSYPHIANIELLPSFSILSTNQLISFAFPNENRVAYVRSEIFFYSVDLVSIRFARRCR